MRISPGQLTSRSTISLVAASRVGKLSSPTTSIAWSKIILQPPVPRRHLDHLEPDGLSDRLITAAGAQARYELGGEFGEGLSRQGHVDGFESGWKDKRAGISPRVSHEIGIVSSRSNPIPQHLLSLRCRLFLEIGERAFVWCTVDV